MGRQQAQVFVTGGAGCVGHYLIEQLLAGGWRVHALVRDPGRLRADLLARVEVIRGDLADPAGWASRLGGMDAAVLAAAAWGGPEAHKVNAAATWRILDDLDPDRCRRVVYLSTASVLGPGGAPLAAAAEHGTEYIRSKHAALAGIQGTRTGSRVVTLFPTVILGGDERHPLSSASRGLRDFRPYLGVLRFVSLDGRFHVVHAHDVARAAVHFLEAAELPAPPVVLGIPALGAGEAMARLARLAGHGPAPQIDLTPLARILPALLPHKFTPWDRYCLAHRDLSYPVCDLAALLGPSGFETLEGILAGPGTGDSPAPEVACAPSP
ncbi:MAG: NAD-dependent epimerase/dehydratase family protein [Candidatus Sericytochromatia bacterium]|nr:NAD-dependent epimerase/dehydratase family protein [Candidatus Tanganyikabacteria bacterium]